MTASSVYSLGRYRPDHYYYGGQESDDDDHGSWYYLLIVVSSSLPRLSCRENTKYFAAVEVTNLEMILLE
jgi:hypothetical protein